MSLRQQDFLYRTSPLLDFIHSGGVTERVGQALEEGTGDLYEVVVFLRQ